MFYLNNCYNFKNLILEDKNIEEDDPFASIEKDIKGNYNRIKNSLTKDGNLIEISDIANKVYEIIDNNENYDTDKLSSKDIENSNEVN